MEIKLTRVHFGSISCDDQRVSLHKAENVSLQHGRKNKNKHNDTNAISDIMFLLPLAFAT